MDHKEHLAAAYLALTVGASGWVYGAGCGGRTALDSLGTSVYADGGSTGSSTSTGTRSGTGQSSSSASAHLRGCGYATPTRLGSVALEALGATYELSPDALDGGFDVLAPITAMVVVNGTVYLAAWSEYGGAEGGFLAKVPTAGGPLTFITEDIDAGSVSPSYFGGPLVQDGVRLYYPHPTFPPGTIIFPYVVSRPLAGGPESRIPNPVPAMTNVSAMAATGNGAAWAEVDWVNYTGSYVLEWDGTTTTELGFVDDDLYGMFVVGQDAYLNGVKTLYVTPLAGGGLTALHSVEAGGGLIAANADSVFFSLDGNSVVRRDAATGAETVLVSGLDYVADGGTTPARRAAYADAEYLYFGLEDGLHRVPVDGGDDTLVVASPVDSGTPLAQAASIAGDDCNLYWVEEGLDTMTNDVMAVGKASL